MTTSKVKSEHRLKPAYVYIRQSSMGQVRYNQESTERQYALRDRVLTMGWEARLIRVLDRDLGISGAQTAGREDFKTLIADVTMGQVGAVVALEASRLARSSADWYRLIEICAYTSTLIIDEDGCYDPSDFNDGLLLGLKGTMSQAELHFIRARLRGGLLNKARKGQLRMALPVGYCYDEDSKIIFDPDIQVQEAVRLFFATFRAAGTVTGVVRLYNSKNLKFPSPLHAGHGAPLVWRRLSIGRARRVIKNPVYAGVYAFGRSRWTKQPSENGEFQSVVRAVPKESWYVNLGGHHEGYISWEEYEENQRQLIRNQPHKEVSSLPRPAREGAALLQGLLLCSVCGRRMSVSYYGKNSTPGYYCYPKTGEGHCETAVVCSATRLRSEPLDDAISERIFHLLEPAQFDIALRALEELKKRDEAVTKQWQLRVEKAEYNATLAQRRYEAVDPANRLVASSLEKRWNEALVQLEEARNELEEYRRTHAKVLTPEQTERALAMARDLPRLWRLPTTQDRERQRMLRLLVSDITVERIPHERRVILHVRWLGGATDDIAVDCHRPRVGDGYAPEVVAMVRELAPLMSDDDVAERLNQTGFQAPRGGTFSRNVVRWIRNANDISSSKTHDGELTVKDVAQRFGVSLDAVYYWIELGLVSARRTVSGSGWRITIQEQQQAELKKRARRSAKRKHKRDSQQS